MGSLNLEILRGGGLKQFWKSRWIGGGGGGGVKKTMPSIVGVWIFSGITHSSEGGTIYLNNTCKMEFVKRSLASLRRRYTAVCFTCK